MRKIYSKLIEELPFRLDPGLGFNFLQAIVRSILQYAAYGALDLCAARRGTGGGTLLGEVSSRLLEPTDGNLPWVIGNLVELLREEGWPGCAPSWNRWNEAPPLDGALPKQSAAALASFFVEFRNNRPAHGVVDEATISAGMQWLPGLARALLGGLADLLPEESAEAPGLDLHDLGGNLPLRSCRLIDGKPVVVRRITRRGSIWRAHYQTLDWRRSIEGAFELEDDAPIVKLVSERPGLYSQLIVPTGPGSDWRPTVLLPQRQTTVFEGRDLELAQLRQWWDSPDSRACLVYGDGGIGKTTLVLEFLHNALQTPWAECWKPDLVSFFSAKETRWGPNGLEELKGISPSLSEAGRQLARVLEDRLDASWFRLGTTPLLSKVVGLLAGVGLRRDRVLLILDNTETLARTSAEQKDLAQGVSFMASRLGRVILTSRRREPLEALPLKVPPMDEEVGIRLLRRLAKEYEASPFLQAGETTLRRATGQLGGRPLLLDILVRFVSLTHCSIERGIEAVLAQAADDLGLFLFQDAWNRIDERSHDVFLVLAQLGSTVDGEVVGWACSEFGMSHADWLDAFEETRFGSILEYGTHYDLSLDQGMREFVIRKYGGLSAADKQRIAKVAARVQGKQVAFLQAQDAETSDRVVDAFRSAAAKAAKMAAARGNYDDATMWYEEAVKADPTNSALLDRFAWFLLMFVHDVERASHCATQACAVGPSDSDAHFTAGMVASRRRDIVEADRLFERAGVLGKPQHLCALQRAKARLIDLEKLDRHHQRVQNGEAERLLASADDLLRQAVLGRTVSANDRKHMQERESVSYRLTVARHRLGLQIAPSVETA